MVTRRKIITSLTYKFAERIASQGVAFIVGIILARLLSPEHFGVIAILMIFIQIAQTFVQSGFNSALIQTKDATEVDYSSVFYATLATSVVFYTALFFAAPFIADFYKMPELTKLMRCLAFVLFPNSYNSIQIAKLTKEMKFQKLMWRSVSASLLSGIIGIIMSYSNFGVWALVIQQIVASTTSCVTMSFVTNWRPRLVISFSRLRSLFSFGWKMLASSLLDVTYKNLQGLIIGKKYSADDLAYYNRGAHYPALVVENLNGSIMSVMFPAFALEQSDKERVKAMVRRTIILSSFFVFPAMAGLAAVAKPLVTIMLTEKWLPCVPYLMISCGIYAFYPIHTVNLQAIAAMGKSGIFFRLEMIKKLYGLTALTITVLCFNTPMAIMLGSLITVPISCTVNAYPNKRILGYSIKEQVKDILPSFIISIITGASVFCVSFIKLHIVVTLIVQVVLGILLYIVMAKILKIEAYSYLLSIIHPIFKRKFEK